MRRTPCLVALAVLALSPPVGADSFSFEDADQYSPGISDYSTSLALDGFGEPAVAYAKPNPAWANLAFARREAGFWIVEIADPSPAVGWYASLALDPTGAPCIAYKAGTDLRYARRSGGVWCTETVDAFGDTGYFASLALDGEGTPHIAYHLAHLDDDQQIPARRIRWATKTGAAWTIETVGEGGVCALALDPAGTPGVAFACSGGLSWATRGAGGWTAETVGDVGTYLSVAIDAQGTVHLSWDGGGDLRYACRTGGSWAIETVDAAGNVGAHSSLALDTNGAPAIAYRDRTNADLNLARRDGAEWTLLPVATEGDVGQRASLALDAFDRPWISFLDNAAIQRIRVARGGGGLDAPTASPAAGTVGAPYPNPCRDEISLAVTLPREGTVALALFDVTGRLVNRRPAGILPGGRSELRWRIAGVPSGVYYLVARPRDGAPATRSVTVLR